MFKYKLAFIPKTLNFILIRLVEIFILFFALFPVPNLVLIFRILFLFDKDKQLLIRRETNAYRQSIAKSNQSKFLLKALYTCLITTGIKAVTISTDFLLYVTQVNAQESAEDK